MSRLDSAIRRLEAQRACLDLAADLIVDLPGPLFEIGLGNGRTYDHLRERMPGRHIFVFDRQVAAHPDCIPPGDRLFLGDVRDTLPVVVERFRGTVALIHADIGSGDTAASRSLARSIEPSLLQLLASGGVLIADQPFPAAGLSVLDPPSGVRTGRYFLYRSM